MKKEGTPFFLVWNPRRGDPTYRHDTLSRATKEAERLASSNPGTFYVLAVVGSAQMTTVETQTFPFDREAEQALKGPFECDVDEDVPF